MFGHICPNNRVSYPGLYGSSASFLHNFRDHSGVKQVVDSYGGALPVLFVTRDLAVRDHGGNSRRRDGVTVLVCYETTLGVAIEGYPNIGLVLADSDLQIHEVRGLNGIS